MRLLAVVTIRDFPSKKGTPQLATRRSRSSKDRSGLPSSEFCGTFGVLQDPKGLEKIQDRLKFSIRTSRLPTKNRGLVGGSLENFKLAWKFQDLELFSRFGPLGEGSAERFFTYQKLVRGRVNREVQTVNWEAGQKGAVETGVKSGLKKAHKPWIRGKNGTQTVHWGGANPWSADCELGTFYLQNSSVSVHNVHFMVCAPLTCWRRFCRTPKVLHNFQARKKSTKINFLGPETARWGGGLPREGVVAENFVPSLESLSSLGFGERNLGCPGNFAGMSRTPGGVQKVCAKKVRAHFPPLNLGAKPSFSGPSNSQEGPRQTKPKEGQFMNFSQGHSGTKVRYVNLVLVVLRKNTRILTKIWAKFMNFSFWPFLWFGLPGRLLKFVNMHAKQGKTQQDHNWPRHRDIGLKSDTEKWFHFHTATPPPFATPPRLTFSQLFNYKTTPTL